MPMDRPVPGPGLDQFMAGLEVVEPDWIHDKAQGDTEGPVDPEIVKEAIIDNLTLVHDPEIPVNIYDLGLVYDVSVTPEGAAKVVMTLTAPNCPVAGSLPAMVERGVAKVPGVRSVAVELTFDPPWTLEMCSEDAKLALGMF